MLPRTGGRGQQSLTARGTTRASCSSGLLWQGHGVFIPNLI